MKMWMWVVVVIVALITLAGCQEPRTTFRGVDVTEATLDLAVEREIQKVKADAEREAAELALQTKKNFAAFQLAVSQVDTTSAMEIQRLTSDYEVSLSEVQFSMQQISNRVEAAIANAEADAQTAQADLNRQYEQRSAGVKALTTVAQFIPGASGYAGQAQPLLLSALGIGGVAYLNARARKQSDNAWDEAAQKTRETEEAKQRARDDEWNAALLFFSQQLAAGRPVVPVKNDTTSSTG